MKLVGLTGGIASGKSTVGKLLAARGIPVVDADQLARDVVAPGSDGLAAIRARFGDEVIADDGTLKRQALGAIVFGNPEALRDLNAITHPAVALLAQQRFMALAEAGHAVAVYEVPLLFENKLQGMMDHTVLVACAPETQRQRVMARDGLDADAAQARIDAQMSLAEKRALADTTIENDGDLAALTRLTIAAWTQVEQALADAGSPT